MWAQLIKMHVKPGKDVGLLSQALRDAEQPGSGLLRRLTMRHQKDPRVVYTLVLFESEENARVREQDPRREEGLQTVRAMMADIQDGPAEFVDLTVEEEWTGP